MFSVSAQQQWFVIYFPCGVIGALASQHSGLVSHFGHNFKLEGRQFLVKTNPSINQSLSNINAEDP